VRGLADHDHSARPEVGERWMARPISLSLVRIVYVFAVRGRVLVREESGPCVSRCVLIFLIEPFMEMIGLVAIKSQSTRDNLAVDF
jgi:hypothetical protein